MPSATLNVYDSNGVQIGILDPSGIFRTTLNIPILTTTLLFDATKKVIGWSIASNYTALSDVVTAAVSSAVTAANSAAAIAQTNAVNAAVATANANAAIAQSVAVNGAVAAQITKDTATCDARVATAIANTQSTERASADARVAAQVATDSDAADARVTKAIADTQAADKATCDDRVSRAGIAAVNNYIAANPPATPNTSVTAAPPVVLSMYKMRGIPVNIALLAVASAWYDDLGTLHVQLRANDAGV